MSNYLRRAYTVRFFIDEDLVSDIREHDKDTLATAPRGIRGFRKKQPHLGTPSPVTSLQVPYA